jgi:membrane-bound lytic murein transglycosylase D
MPETYRVAPGDNPWAIARRFGIALEELLAWNGLEAGAVLGVGQTLALREPAAAAGESTGSQTARAARTYEVRRGDTLWQIARRFDTSIQELQRLNGFEVSHDLQPGDRVILP